MRSIKLAGSAAVVAAALSAFVGVAPAAAVSWSPQNTVEAGTLASGSSLVMKDNKGSTVTCTTANASVLAPVNGNAAIAGTVNSSGSAAPPSFSNCTSSLGSATVTATGQWLFTATSTTSVDASNASATIKIGGGLCTITISKVTAKNNAWSNTTHQLTLNGSDTFPVSESGLCDGATSASQSGTLQMPSAVTIG